MKLVLAVSHLSRRSSASCRPPLLRSRTLLSAEDDFLYGSDYTGFGINAQSGPTGLHPSGTFSYSGFTSSFTFSASGSVSCLAVNGNFAVVGVYGTLNRYSPDYGGITTQLGRRTASSADSVGVLHLHPGQRRGRLGESRGRPICLRSPTACPFAVTHRRPR